MGKTLVIAEKPSVGRDLTARAARARSRSTRATSSPTTTSSRGRSGTSSSSPSPRSTAPQFKKWRMADLPIVPDRFKLVVRDERSKKQMTVITKLLKRDDVDEVINACDAGREGELIFAYIFEKAEAKKPVQRLWLSSMTKQAISDGVRARCARPRSSPRSRRRPGRAPRRTGSSA